MNIEELLKLRSNALNHENKTGYPHLDLSHLQYYTEDAIKNYGVPDLSMYGLLYKSIIENKMQNLVAMEYFGRKITYEEFLRKTNDYASAFTEMGVKKGEVVSIASPNIPEVFYAIYALNKIGAIANLIDPRNNLDRIKQYINQVNSEKLIMLDIVYPKIMRIIEDTNLKTVYTISASDSLPLGLNYIQSAKTIVENHRKGLPNCPKNDVYMPLTKLVSEHRKEISFEPSELTTSESVRDNVAVVINTSGTTGTPKGVMLTNKNLNAVALDYRYSGMNEEVGDKFLGIMPNFLAYGVGVGLHMPLVLGLTNVIIPSFKPEDFPKLILKHKPNHFAGVPSYYQYLIENPKAQKADLSFIKTPAAGGDAMDQKLKRKTNEFLQRHNCQSKIVVGYGCSENTGLAATQIYVGESTLENELSTVGIPALNTGIRIVSLEDGRDLKYNETGEVLLTGEGVMKEYVNNPEETQKVIEIKDGIRHLHTGDVGRVDEEGRLYIVDRLKRMIVRQDGHNVFPLYIENVATSHPYVKACTCVGLKNEKVVNGHFPVAFIQLEEGHEAEVEKIIEELKTLALEKLPERDVAFDYVVVDHIPETGNGKIDYKYFEENYTYDGGLSRKRIQN